ncbi:MAG: glycosyltransferase family 4 protein, partial [Planctomycetes bacterium]|nr:glycosyltransferase family 4 protein [Planctomycetota bacterium]
RKRGAFRAFLRELVIGSLVRHAAACLPLGTLAKNYLVAMGANPERCSFCPDTPDVEAMQLQCAALPSSSKIREENQLPTKKPLFLYVGRFVESKRVDLLIKAYALLRGREVDAALVLVGSGLKESAFRQQVKERNIKDLYFLGYKQPAELPALYTMADATILPSDEEPWGVVVNESLACGTPVIASDHVGAAPDLIESNRTGNIFRAGDVEALTATMRRFINLLHQSEPKAIADACREQALAWGYKLCKESFLSAVMSAALRKSRRRKKP